MTVCKKAINRLQVGNKSNAIGRQIKLFLYDINKSKGTEQPISDNCELLMMDQREMWIRLLSNLYTSVEKFQKVLWIVKGHNSGKLRVITITHSKTFYYFIKYILLATGHSRMLTFMLHQSGTSLIDILISIVPFQR